jgi:isopentenyl phosphate kinase
MKQMLMVKLGGGVITDKNVHYGLREDVLSRLASEIARGYAMLGESKLIIGNGAGSFAHFSAHKYKTTEGFVDENSRVGMGWVRHDAVKLNQIVFEQLLLANVPVFSYSPSSLMSVSNRLTKQIFTESIEDGLKNGIVPLVYGDVVVDALRGCDVYSTERVFDELAKYFAKNYQVKVIHVSAEEGVYKTGQASVFEKITKDNFEEVKQHLGGSKGVDVSGGMLHKVEECLELTKLGINSLIVSGMVEGRVAEVISGKKTVGTIIC